MNIFIDGMIVKKPPEKAPDFIKATFAVKVADFINFAKKHEVRGWLNFNLKESKEGRYYLALDVFQKKEPQDYAGKELEEKLKEPEINLEEEIRAEDLPF